MLETFSLVEYTVRREDTIFVHRPVSKRKNIMETGSGIHKGEIILTKSQRLSPREIGVIAALGLTEVGVYKRPKVAVISTGPEVVEPGKPLPPGKI